MVYLLPGMQEKSMGCNIIRIAMQMYKSVARPRQQNEGEKRNGKSPRVGYREGKKI